MGESPARGRRGPTPPERRSADLAKLKREVDVLWFVECYTSYYARGQDNSRATAKLFHALGVDFAILGNEEKCAGECGRLTWEPGLFESCGVKRQLFSKYKFRRIVTSDAHAFNAFRYIYPVYGFNQPVEHTTPFFARHLETAETQAQKEARICGDLPRRLLPGPGGGFLQRTPRPAARHPRRAARGNGSPPRQFHVLRGRRRGHVVGHLTSKKRGWNGFPNGASRRPSPRARTCSRCPAPMKFPGSRTL